MSTKWKEILTKDQFEILDSYDNPRIDDIIDLVNRLNLDIKDPNYTFLKEIFKIMDFSKTFEILTSFGFKNLNK